MENALWSVLEAPGVRGSKEARGKKIFEELSGALEHIEDIQSVEVIPGEGDLDSSLVTSCEGHIGVRLQAVPPLFSYAYKRLMDGEDEDAENLSRCVLFCCPDNTTVWNARKRRLMHDTDVSTHKKELALAILVLNLHPKSSETFAHRRWVVRKISGYKMAEVIDQVVKQLGDQCQNHTLSTRDNVVTEPLCSGVPPRAQNEHPDSSTESQPPKILIAEREHKIQINDLFDMARCEFSVCKLATQKQRSNYNAWAHWRWTIDNLILKLYEDVIELGKKHGFENDLQDQSGEGHNQSSHSYHGNIEINEAIVGVSRHGSSSCARDFLEMIREFMRIELISLVEFADKHISDISVLNAVLHTLVKLTKMSLLDIGAHEQVISIWVNILHQNNKMLNLYAEHEALWCYRRNLFIAFHKTFAHGDTSVSFEEFSVENEEKFVGSFHHNVASSLAKHHVEFLNKFLPN